MPNSNRSMTKLRIMVSRHSAFYTPLLATLAAGFLRKEGLEADYAVMAPGQRSHELIREGAVDVVQTAVSSNWKPMESGLIDLPVHFAQINRRDGFFLVARQPDPAFEWKKLKGKSVLADHGLQPLVMLRYAAHVNGVDWQRVEVIDVGAPERMEAAFRAGRGDYVHLQGPAPQQLETEGFGQVVASVGEAMPPVAFSSLAASRRFLGTAEAKGFVRAYRQARKWARQTSAAEIARAEAGFFPGLHASALEAAIARYQKLGCWEGDLAIPRDLYEQALAVFLHAGAIARTHAFEGVVVAPPE